MRKNIMDDIKCPECKSNYYELCFIEDDRECVVIYHGSDYASIIHKGIVPKHLKKYIKRPRLTK